MRIVRKIVAVMLILSVVLALTACGKNKTIKECTWDGYDFKVQYETTADSDSKTKKVVRLKLVMDKEGMPQDVFEKKVEDGNILIRDVEPSNMYLYTKNKNGDVTSANLSFFMPGDYVFDESDLNVKE